MPEYTIVEFFISMREVYFNDIVLLVKLCYTKSCMPLLFMSYYQGTLFLNMLSWENGFSYLPTYITNMRSNIAFWKMPGYYISKLRSHFSMPLIFIQYHVRSSLTNSTVSVNKYVIYFLRTRRLVLSAMLVYWISKLSISMGIYVKGRLQEASLEIWLKFAYPVIKWNFILNVQRWKEECYPKMNLYVFVKNIRRA